MQRFVIWPWWRRMLTYSAFGFLIVGISGVLLIPLVPPSRLPYLLAVWLPSSVVLGGLLTMATQRAHREFLNVTADLNAVDRERVRAASYDAQILDDPELLRAQVRVYSRFRNLKPTVGPSHLGTALNALVLAACGAVYLVFAGSRVGFSTVRLVFSALGWAVAIGWLVVVRYRRRRRNERVRLSYPALIAAADERLPGGFAAIAAQYPTVRSQMLSEFLYWQLAVGVAWLLLGGLMFAWLSPPASGCRAAGKLVNYLGENTEVFDAYPQEPGSPTQDRYDVWAARVRELAEKVKGPDVKQHADRIAQLADEVTQFVRETRAHTGTPSEAEQQQSYDQYDQLLAQIVDEDNVIFGKCGFKGSGGSVDA